MRPASPHELLRSARVPAFLVTNLVNIHYLTGLELSAGVLLVTPRRMTLFTDPRYREAAEEGHRGFTVSDLEELPAVLRRVPLCGFESDAVTVWQRERWGTKFRGTRFVPRAGIIRFFRRSKDGEELRKFRRAQRITRELIRRVPHQLQSAVTERGLAEKLRVWAHALGAGSLAFDPVVAFGSSTSRPHHHPTPRALKRGDIVQVDVGARFEGYCADQSAVFFTGRKTSEQERALAAVLEAKAKAERAVRAGASTHDLDRLARKILEEHGVEDAFGHSLGHGIGLEVHEGVTLSQKRPEERLLQSEIVTIEPGVYFPGKFGIRLEDEVVVGG